MGPNHLIPEFCMKIDDNLIVTSLKQICARMPFNSVYLISKSNDDHLCLSSIFMQNPGIRLEFLLETQFILAGVITFVWVLLR